MQTFPLWPENAAALRDGVDDGFVPTLDCYASTNTLPDPTRRRPALVIFPGGAYVTRAPHEGVTIAEYFNQFGFHCFVVQYRVAPHRYPAPQQDAFRAIQLIRANSERFGCDPHQLATIGFSAGGHLCACAGLLYDDPTIDSSAGDEADTQPRRPDVNGLAYPVISSDFAFGHQGSFDNLLGPDATPELRARLSLENRVPKDAPPTFLWTTSEDTGVPPRNSFVLYEKLHSLGIPAEVHCFARGHHGLGLAPDWPDVAQWPQLYLAFLRHTAKFNC
ncbi:MAG: alpha/beta hydrolase [Victivallales bacterium]|nr:alpha/beta hydrolase [Victivallales bacterium]